VSLSFYLCFLVTKKNRFVLRKRIFGVKWGIRCRLSSILSQMKSKHSFQHVHKMNLLTIFTLLDITIKVILFNSNDANTLFIIVYLFQRLFILSSFCLKQKRIADYASVCVNILGKVFPIKTIFDKQIYVAVCFHF
jgi:hypothetical protein